MNGLEAAQGIAIVGVGCRFPGGVTSVEAFWKLVLDGVDAVSEIPADRMDVLQFYDERSATPGRMMTRRGGFVGRLEDFDAMFFGIAPRDAERLDPQQRLLLETAWESLEDAGIDAIALQGSDTAVFMGQWTSDFENRLFANVEAVDFPMTLGSGRYAAAARVSYALGLRGPSLSIDAACSSGLACVHLAVQSLRRGECRLALAGAANIILQPHIHIAYSQSRMMAPDGRCKFGDATGDGYVRSEGVAVLVLKPLEAARQDGDRVYAVIRGSAVNNDGSSSGSMGRPSRIGQVELLQKAYADAGVAASAVGYVEAHGTGTRAGDPVELAAIAEAMSGGSAEGSRAWVGSVKTNFGHTEAAAGLAGLIKAALVVRNEIVPPSLHFHQPNPSIPWDQLPVAIPQRVEPLPSPAGRRLAGVSAYGIGGTNAHVVVEAEPARTADSNAVGERTHHLLTLSSRNDAALRDLALRHADRLARGDAIPLARWCAAAAQRRSSLELRAAFVARTSEEMIERLRAFAAGTAPATAEGRAYGPTSPGIVFVVPGQGAQWAGMARELMHRSLTFRESVVACELAMRPWVDWSLVEMLEAGVAFERIDHVQPALVALAIAYAHWLGEHGVLPSAVIGHSMGEVAAAYIAGALTLEQAMRIVCRRSQLMRRASGRGAMAMVDLSKDEAEGRIAVEGGAMNVAVDNGPRSCVVSGEPDAIHRLVATLTREGVFCRLVKVDVASHSAQMQPLADELAAELSGLRPAAPNLPLYSTVNARLEVGPAFDAAYWGRNLREPVRFREAVDAALSDRHAIFVELSPHAVLSTAIQQTAQAAKRDVATLASGQRGESDSVVTLSLLGSLWSFGVKVDWPALHGGRAPHVDLPFYPWQRERHWTPFARPVSLDRESATAHDHTPAEYRSWLHSLQWVDAPALADALHTGQSAPPWLVVAESRQLGDPLVAALATAGAKAVVHPFDENTLADALGRRCSGIVIVARSDREAPFAALDALGRLVESTRRESAAPGPRAWLVTRGGTSASAAADRPAFVDADQAAIWGIGRVFADEHPELWGGLIDLCADASPADVAAAVVREVLSGDTERQVAYRAGQRLVPRLLPLKDRDALPAASAWRRDAAYLITGGLGEIGLQVAKAMVRGGARRLLLLGRSPLPDRELWSSLAPGSRDAARCARIREIEGMGAAVHLLWADVGNRDELERVLGRYSTEGWPAIRGVVHAAGSHCNRLIDRMDRADFATVYRTKVDGARYLQELLPELDHFILFSSVIGLLGTSGMANYAAANAGLDAIASSRRAGGRPALSVLWGPWEQTGLLSGDSAEQGMQQLRDIGIQGFDVDAGVTVFDYVRGATTDAVAVLHADWQALSASRRGRDRLFSRPDLDGSAAMQAPGETLAASLAVADAADRRRLLELVVREALGRTLNIAPVRVDAQKPFGAMGLGSLAAMEFRNRLEVAIGRPLPATIAWNYPTVESLSGFLVGVLSTGADSGAPVGSPARVADTVDAGSIAAMSDDQVALLLKRRR